MSSCRGALIDVLSHNLITIFACCCKAKFGLQPTASLPEYIPMFGSYKYECTSGDYLIPILPTSFQIFTSIAT